MLPYELQKAVEILREAKQNIAAPSALSSLEKKVDDVLHILEDPKYLYLSWCVEDIYACVEDIFDKTLSEKGAIAILENIGRRHDATIGVNWSVIKAHIEDYMADNPERSLQRRTNMSQCDKAIELLHIARSRMEDVINGLEPKSHLDEITNDIHELLDVCIEKQLVVSTAHIQSSDAVLLKKASNVSAIISADEFPFGWHIYVSDNDLNEEEEKVVLKKEGYSDEFCHLYFMTRRCECTFLCLDCDAKTYDWLPTFD